MKFFGIIFTLLIFTANSFAQLKTDKGLAILPEAGEWAVGVYSDDEFTITMKKVKDLNTHKRYRLRLGLNSTSEIFKVQDDKQAAASGNIILVDDKVTVTSTDIMFLYGVEKRKGKGRVQGFYGVEGGFGLSSKVVKNSFVNSLSFENQTPSTTIPGQDGIFPRTTESKLGTGFNFELNGLVGAEYFFLDKVSLGLEWIWGLGISTIGEGEAKTEEYDSVNSQVVNTTTNTGKSTTFNFGSDDITTRIRLLFYF